VDEFVIAVGKGDDETAARITELSEKEGSGKIIHFETVWELDDPEKRKGGLILSEQTNIALDRCTGDWCFYLQADEVLHESDYPRIREALRQAHSRPEIEGLLFDYVHFYGSYDVVQHSRSAYRREVRCIRHSAGGRSLGDAQSFRKPNGEKLSVIHSRARIFHYGWVRTPDAMREKTFFMDQLYHGKADPEAERAGTPATGNNYRYKRFWGLQPFRDVHPAVMHNRISAKGWHWDLTNSPFHWTWRDSKKIILDTIESLTGRRFFEYRPYRLKR